MRDPDYVGLARVWKIEKSEILEQGHLEKFGYPSTQVGATYLVNGPYHPVWSWWYIATVSLKDIPGVPVATKRYPEAEYEIMCLSLNPTPELGRSYPPDVDKIEAGDVEGGLPGYLVPPDFVVQWHGTTEEQAAEVTDLVALHISRGHSCDSDYRRYWEGVIVKTVEHFTTGHPELN